MLLEWLYCFTRTTKGKQDIDWKEEAEVAEDLGFVTHSFDFESLLDGRLDLALADLPDGDGQTLAYRGWILEGEAYAELEDELSSRGYSLLTNAHQYVGALELPNYFELVEDMTPPAVWTYDPDIDEAWELYQSFGGKACIIKDHVKSAKEAWLEACFIPENAPFGKFKSICEELVERRAEHFCKGFVIRPFAPLKQLGAHWIGFPIYDEYRLIFWRGEMIVGEPYSDLCGKERDFSKFEHLGGVIDSPLFVADVARQEDGEMILIEINDGGVAGLPPTIHPVEFYRPIAKREGSLDQDDELF